MSTFDSKDPEPQITMSCMSKFNRTVQLVLVEKKTVACLSLRNKKKHCYGWENKHVLIVPSV